MSLGQNQNTSPSCTNIYAELGKLKQEVADRITSSKTNGGRSLNAIWALDIPSTHKLILVYIGSKIDFTKNFIEDYETISLTEIFNQTSCSKNTVLRVINGYTEKNKNGEKRIPGLIEMGYLKKITPTKAQCIQNHVPSGYCLTSKAFDEYMIKMIQWENVKYSESAQKPGKWSFFHQNKIKTPNKKRPKKESEERSQSIETHPALDDTPSATMGLGLVPRWNQGTSHGETRASATVGHYFPSNPPSSSISPVCEDKTNTSVTLSQTDKRLTITNESSKADGSIDSDQKKNQTIFQKKEFRTYTHKRGLQRINNPQEQKDQLLKRLQIALSMTVCKSLRLKFLDNDICGEVIKSVIGETNYPLEKFTIVINDIKKYDFVTSDEKSKMTHELVEWINSRSERIQKIEEEQRNFETQKLEYEQRIDALRKKRQEEESHPVSKKKMEPCLDKIELLPMNIKDWYSKLSPRDQKIIREEIREQGATVFIKTRFPVLEKNFSKKMLTVM